MRRLLALAALVTGLAGCRNTISVGGPPIVICGQTLWSGEMVPVVYQIPPGRGTPLPVPTLAVGSDDFVIVRVAPGCDHGAQVVIEPPGALVVAAQAKARDGELVGVRFSAGLQPEHALIIVDRANHKTGSLSVLVEPPSTPTTS